MLAQGAALGNQKKKSMQKRPERSKYISPGWSPGKTENGNNSLKGFYTSTQGNTLGTQRN